MAVVLINPFTVAPEREDEFLASWAETAEIIRTKPGFLSARLHRSLDAGAPFRFINVAQWESAEAWRAAFKDFRPRELGPGVTAHPALFEVVREH